MTVDFGSDELAILSLPQYHSGLNQMLSNIEVRLSMGIAKWSFLFPHSDVPCVSAREYGADGKAAEIPSALGLSFEGALAFIAEGYKDIKIVRIDYREMSAEEGRLLRRYFGALEEIIVEGRMDHRVLNVLLAPRQ